MRTVSAFWMQIQTVGKPHQEVNPGDVLRLGTSFLVFLLVSLCLLETEGYPEVTGREEASFPVEKTILANTNSHKEDGVNGTKPK